MRKEINFLLFVVLFTPIFIGSNLSSENLAYNQIPSLPDTAFPALNYNATSSVEFFNETSFPRYYLAARLYGMIEYPNKINPAIVIYNEDFQVITTSSFDTTGWNFTLIDGNVSVSLDIVNSNYVDEKWYFTVLPEIQKAGLYDLQLNCSEGSDYQTHAVKVIEEETYPFSFVQISDVHLPAYYQDFNTTDICLQEFENIKALNPDFVIVTGDLMQGPTTFMVDPDTGRALAFEIQIRITLWALDTLNLPIYYVHGNHEFSQTNYVTDNLEEQWYRYFGPIRYQNHSYLDWTFVGFGSSFEGLTSAELDKVEEILSQNSDEATVLYYHYDFISQATSLWKRYPIEVMLSGHEHQEVFDYRLNTLFHQQEPLFRRAFTLFSITDESSMNVNSEDYSFELIPYTPPETSKTSLSILSILMPLGLVVYSLYQKKK